jgi:methylmalonyl-CoA mutase N-terminal domain/subunit
MGELAMSHEYEKDSFKKSLQEWREARERTLAKSPERFDRFRTSAESVVQPLYTPADIKEMSFSRDISFPGQYPYTRGVYPNGYRSQLWNIQQVAGYGLADDTNRRLKKLRSEGQHGVDGKDTINVVFDLPTHYGFDSDMPEAEGEVGRLGVVLDSLADMEMMLEGFRPDNTFVSFIVNHPAVIVLSMYIAYAEKMGIDSRDLMGVMQNDPLSTFLGSKSFIFPPKASMKLISDIYSYCSENLPKWNLNGIVGYHFREAGGTAVQEIAFAIAHAMAYIDAGTRAGLEVDAFVPKFSFFFSIHNDLFEEVAKLRAARRLWARLMKEKYNSVNPRTQMMRFHLQTAGSTLTAQQPENNIVRVAIQALAGILGGAQGLHTNSKDEAFGLPTEETAKLALRTQQIIAYESGVTETVDPMAGSYYLESLTDEIEAKAVDTLDTIQGFGDNMLEAVVNGLDQGFFHKELADASYRYHKAVEKGEKVIVGVNKFAENETETPVVFKADPGARDRQIERLEKIRNDRDEQALERSLMRLAEAIDKDENIFPFVLDAVKRYGTLGEIIKVMTDVYGRYRDLTII